MTAGELFGAERVLAASRRRREGAAGAGRRVRPLWSLWGRGDLGTFAGRGEPGLSYDGELRTGWLGLGRAGRRLGWRGSR